MLALVGGSVCGGLARLAPALTAAMHSSAAMRAPSAALASTAVGNLQQLLGCSSPEAQHIVERMPDLASTKTSVLQERMEMLTAGLGISPARLRNMVLEKPALLSDLSMRELRSLTGLSE